jgi:hypothetical protein
MKRLYWIIVLSVFVLSAHAERIIPIRDVRAKIDSMQHLLYEYRDSARLEIKAYRDSLRDIRRHAPVDMPHYLRVGWGDQLFETLIWRDLGHQNDLPQDYEAKYDENFRYTQHWFVEYLYRLNYRYSFGLLMDYSGVVWDNVLRNGKGEELGREVNREFHNIAIVPTVRFSYKRYEYVSLYSAIGAGLNVNTGTETDYKGRETVVAPAINITLLGVSVSKGRWYGALEVGGMLSFNSAEEVYMLGSRIMTASVGVRL